jgi:hypothetical protein
VERFRRFLERTIDPARLSDPGARDALGFRDRWVPDVLEAFDEVELARSLDAERDLVITVAVEEGRIARILFGWCPAGDDDADRRGFTEGELTAVLEQHGDAAAAGLDQLVGPVS